MTNTDNPFRILCLDGGGGKGVYTLGVLREVELRIGKPLNQYFHLIYGTSTGSIIAAALAKGIGIKEIINFYYDHLPKIMKTYFASRRSFQLRNCLADLFKDDTFASLGSVGLGIVATNLRDNKPLIFKNLPALAHGLKHSFEPGFGVTIADAVEASCSAMPFFKPKTLNLKNASKTEAVDGGFVANNPSLYALIDARKALSIPDSNIRILSVGTGTYPEKYPIHSYLSGVRLSPAKGMISMQFSSNSNSVDILFRLLAHQIAYVRINETFAEPELTTSLFEHRRKVLERLLSKGRDSFASQENEINRLIGT